MCGSRSLTTSRYAPSAGVAPRHHSGSNKPQRRHPRGRRPISRHHRGQFSGSGFIVRRGCWRSAKRAPLPLTLQAQNFLRRIGNSQTRVAIHAHGDDLVIAVIDHLHLSLADGTRRRFERGSFFQRGLPEREALRPTQVIGRNRSKDLRGRQPSKLDLARTLPSLATTSRPHLITLRPHWIDLPNCVSRRGTVGALALFHGAANKRSQRLALQALSQSTRRGLRASDTSNRSYSKV